MLIEKKHKILIINLYILLYVCVQECIFSWGIESKLNLYKIMFGVAIGLFLLVMEGLPTKTISSLLQAFFLLLIEALYVTQFLYFKVFSMPYVLNSLSGASDAFEFFDVAITTTKENWVVISCMLFHFIGGIIAIYKKRKIGEQTHKNPKPVLIACVMVTLLAVSNPILFSQGIGSPAYLMIYEFIPIKIVHTFGVIPTTLLDVKYMLFGEKEYDIPVMYEEEIVEVEQEIIEEVEIIYEPNSLSLEFNLEEENEARVKMNQFFSSREATMKNEYTGMFQGKNLILITAEGFSSAMIDESLTPTLYRMSQEGFQFENFYTPIWGVSTSDGEYVATTGLLPKAGVWSYTKIAENYMPFAFGNQFRTQGVKTLAFHNHSYTYYNRDQSYPAMGYDFYAPKNGLDVVKQWPESDLEMMELSVPMYIEEEEFHVYYMTVSGHLEYNFGGNMMAAKHKEKVLDLAYSDAVKAYIACNLELEYAMESLIQQLEAAGKLEDTVIAISADHYPYGLTNEQYAELYGKESLGTTFELYKNGFLLWNSEMETPIPVEKVSSSLDIAPTLSNLFGLPYDSRLYIGRDILSNAEGLVMFLDRSFLTDTYSYNANTGEISAYGEPEIEEEKVEQKKAEVANLFRYSAGIIEENYYQYLKDYCGLE